MGRKKKPQYIEPVALTPEEVNKLKHILKVSQERIAELKEAIKTTSGWKEKEFIRASIRANKKMYDDAFRRYYTELL